MYPGSRGGRGAGRGGFSLRGVPPQLMKPGRGGGPFRGAGAGFRPSAPSFSGSSWRPISVQPLFPPRGYPGGYGGSPRTPMRGAGGSPRGLSRGMGPRTPMALSGSRGRGRGRGQTPSRGRGRGGANSARGAKATTKAATPSKETTSSPPSGKSQTKNKSEREKDALMMTRPWVTEAMCAEIRKKHELQDISFKTKSDEDFNNFKEQRTKVTNMLRVAKMEYIGSQDETDIEKIMAVAKKNSRQMPPVAKAGSSLEAEGDSTATNGSVDKTQNGTGHTPTAGEQPAVA